MTTAVDTHGAAAWLPDPSEFPAKGSVEGAIRFCLRYAVLAPSGHNAQPWWFRLDGNTVTIGLDVSRGLAVVDPDDREGTMSVGAALFTLRVALAHFGLWAHVENWPDPVDPEACARVTALFGGPVEGGLEPLFDAIVRRRTSRRAYDATPVAPELLDTLALAASSEGARLHTYAERADREALATLVAQADRRQMADPRFRRELASWLRRPGSLRRDGLHGYAPTSPLTSVALASPLVVRTFDMGSARAAHDSELATGSTVLAVLSTPRDDRQAWLDAGQALARIQLQATLEGLSTGFLDQAVEVAESREALATMLGDGSAPQLLLRLGYGPAEPAQPRRALERSLAG